MRVTATILFLFVILGAGVTESNAEALRVSFEGSYEDKMLELPEGEKGVVEIHLMSFGRPVDGYIVGLLTFKNQRLVARATSDEYGVIRFSGVKPGRYHAAVIKGPGGNKGDIVEIGDVELEIDEREAENESAEEQDA